MLRSIRVGHQQLQVLTDNLVGLVAEDQLGGAIERLDRAGAISDDDGIDDGVEDGAVAIYALAQRATMQIIFGDGKRALPVGRSGERLANFDGDQTEHRTHRAPPAVGRRQNQLNPPSSLPVRRHYGCITANQPLKRA